MLRSLHIENYVLIDSLDVEFPEGLSIITGQTGAGKSILLGALSLLMGGKGDASLISEGAGCCVVEGEFSVDASMRGMLEEAEVEWEDGILTIRRVLSRSGRARAFINDSPVNVQLLQDLSASLVDIHSQHQSLKLSDKRFQMQVLDAFARNADLLKECRAGWEETRALEKELESARQRLARLVADREYNEAQFRRLDESRLRDGELEELEAEQKQLANAESIKENFAGLRALFEPSEGTAPDMALKEAERLMGKVSAFIPSAAELSERLRSARVELDDIYSTATAMDEGVQLSEERLQQVEDRMGLLYSLMQKHGCRSVAELIAERDRYSEALFDSDSLEERISTLEADLDNSRKKHLGICAELHSRRAAAAPGLAAGIEESLHELELDRAVFRVNVIGASPRADGADDISFEFSSTGAAPADVSKCASGGEISRIMLSLKAMMARFEGMPTMIFDEIDTGVSGSTADRMGSMICRMGDDMQVIAITHLPQVAAKGTAHFVVEKNSSAAAAVSSVRRLDDEGRVQEIARLLSGSDVTPEAVANARRLLGR